MVVPQNNGKNKSKSDEPSITVQLNKNRARKIGKAVPKLFDTQKKNLAKVDQAKKSWQKTELRMRNSLIRGKKNLQQMQDQYSRFVAQRQGLTHAGRPQTRSPLVKETNVVRRREHAPATNGLHSDSYHHPKAPYSKRQRQDDVQFIHYDYPGDARNVIIQRRQSRGGGGIQKEKANKTKLFVMGGGGELGF